MKEGINYIPFPVIDDERVELLIADCGIKGFGIFVKLLQRIGEKHGYYAEWSDRIEKLFAVKQVGESKNTVSEVVKSAIREDLFDKTMFEKYSILTSVEIQKSYLKITERRKNSGIDERYSLVNIAQKTENVHKNAKNVCKNTKNESTFEQSKVKERKVKESKAKESKANKNIHTSGKPDVVSANAHHFDYQLFADYWNNHVAGPTGISTVRSPSHWTDTRKRNLRTRVKAEGEKVVLAVFDMVRQSDFLSGRATGWQANFDWVLKAGNFQKIADGNYKNRGNGQQKESYYDKVIRGEA